MFRFLLLTLGVVAVLAAADFQRWLNQVSDLTPPAAVEADAIVALTGGSGLRIAAAVRLLEAGSGKRLLVSGVHESVDVEALVHGAGGTQALYDCCIDFGRSAASTEGNAIETAEWIKDNGYSSLILVTSDYHMPRSLIWFDELVEGVDVIAYPVETRIRPKEWWRSWVSIKGLVLEWAKYRVTGLLRTIE
ncbi:MAG: hypothetical protein CMK06_02325 [Ponticaulis sp.]|mgnify:FL=1|nr:hypothetical protein [Ponticaulis sp.]|tara:strand:+ start:20961 stop:21533 length:573 start_codon:yes stop_codon:yes gene_type:complete